MAFIIYLALKLLRVVRFQYYLIKIQIIKSQILNLNFYLIIQRSQTCLVQMIKETIDHFHVLHLTIYPFQIIYYFLFRFYKYFQYFHFLFNFSQNLDLHESIFLSIWFNYFNLHHFTRYLNQSHCLISR